VLRGFWLVDCSGDCVSLIRCLQPKIRLGVRSMVRDSVMYSTKYAVVAVQVTGIPQVGAETQDTIY
jgi:hypothetical protein